MKPILLHICCAPCATHCVEFLRAHDYEPTLFFSNSNIMPLEEYQRRLETAQVYAQAVNAQLVVDSNEHAAWRAAVQGLEHEPEKGARCTICFTFNLTRTARYAASHGFAEFTTSLTVSPHKPSVRVFEAGYQAAEAVRSDGSIQPVFQPFDFKKKNGFLRSLELSRTFNLYRQSYCGCRLSTPN